MHVAHLRKELNDALFIRTGSGIAFTPGGLRLARRAAELLGLQDRTVREVGEAGAGRRLMHVAASSSFAEHAAPGLIALFTSRAKDLDVELSVRRPQDFVDLLASREVDAAVGPRPRRPLDDVLATHFLTAQTVVVATPGVIAAGATTSSWLRRQTWLLGPAAESDDGPVRQVLDQIGVPEGNQRIFQSTSAALDEARRGAGLCPVPSFGVTGDLATGVLEPVATVPPVKETWWFMTPLEHQRLPAAAELARFVTTPRATQAMIRGAGVTVGHFRPAVHVTLWS